MTETALRSEVDQVVILGAGFDARAYRLAAMSRVTVVFEVDHPSTSTAKRAFVQDALGSLPANVRFVPVDFNLESLPSKMDGAGYDPHRRTLFVWEGVTNYLTKNAVDATLRWCAAAAPGSTVIFTYIHQHVLDSPQAFYGTKNLFAAIWALALYLLSFIPVCLICTGLVHWHVIPRGPADSAACVVYAPIFWTLERSSVAERAMNHVTDAVHPLEPRPNWVGR